MGRKSDQNDRATEHWEAFNSFKAVTQFLLVEGNSLGRVIEVGAGPWTQFKGKNHTQDIMNLYDLFIVLSFLFY